jgi:hypothetical protein
MPVGGHGICVALTPNFPKIGRSSPASHATCYYRDHHVASNDRLNLDRWVLLALWSVTRCRLRPVGGHMLDRRNDAR